MIGDVRCPGVSRQSKSRKRHNNARAMKQRIQSLHTPPCHNNARRGGGLIRLECACQQLTDVHHHQFRSNWIWYCLWDSKYPPPPCISYANVRNYYGPYAHCSLDKGVAYTRGGGGVLAIHACLPGPFVVFMWALLFRRATRQVTGPSLCVRNMHAVRTHCKNLALDLEIKIAFDIDPDETAVVDPLLSYFPQSVPHMRFQKRVTTPRPPCKLPG